MDRRPYGRPAKSLTWTRAVAAAALALVLVAPGAPAEAAQPAQAGTEDAAQEGGIAPDYGEIDTLNKYADPESREAHVSPTRFLQRYFEAKARLRENAGFNYIVEYAPILQWGGGEFHADHELNLIGLLNVVGGPEKSTGNVLVWFQHSYTLGGLTTSEFMDDLGVLSPVNGGDTSPGRAGNRLHHFAWEQLLAKERVRLMIGKLTSRVTIDQNRYAVSDREDFFTPMIVNNTVVPFTARGGLGLFAKYDAGPWYVSTLVRDADASSNYIDFSSLGTGNWEYAVEAALTPTVRNWGAGNYRATYHYTDAIGEGASYQPQGWSLSLSFDQDLGEDLGAYFRYAYANTPLRVFRERGALGVQWLKAFGYDDDRVGIGVWWGKPSDRELETEYGVELFWRLQILRIFELTPDIQVIIDPALNPTRDVAIVAGLRLRAVL